ncbi:MAG: putative DNA binding domain-containing protein [Myxococcota bacterium]
MTVSAKEKDFEDFIEAHLLEHGWSKGDPAKFDRNLALHVGEFIDFVKSTQADAWNELSKSHKNLESTFIDRLTTCLEKQGALEVIRHGFKFYGKKIDVAYFKPAHTLNPDILEKYEHNGLMVTRQVKFIPDADDSVDLVLSLNGIPVVTVELKNQLTGQDVDDAIKQYKRRDPKHLLFCFNRRSLVHFAVGPERAAMATKLAGKNTVFLPFNRGNEGGAGNPPHDSGCRTAYLWESIWRRESILDILSRFVHLKEDDDESASRKTKKYSLIFPRFHQLDAVRRLEAAAREEGAGHNYLIQHSAGSGKSNSIAWLAYRLSSLHDARDKKVFDSVVVVTDRRVLDKQLQDTIYQFEHKAGVVERIDKHSSQLAEALTKGTPVIITTLQKFPFVAEKIGELPSRNYAVVVDEAHSSQTGEAAKEMKQVLGVGEAEALEEAARIEEGDEPTYEDEIAKVMTARGKQSNLSFFAFTATPKPKTLEIFGRPSGPDDKPMAFHVYTMRQAIEEGFILDVLRNYTTYKTYYKLVKSIEDDPEVDRKKATKQLARFMSLHPHNIAQKTEVMVEHFRQKVRHKIGGKAKAMVVTSSRLHAVKYKQAFDKYIKENGYTKEMRTLVAFSGTVIDEKDMKYTEPDMNRQDGKPIPERELPKRFDTDEYQVLLVANKFQTGFDQPLLLAMYVDKRLAGVHAVQTLSRLNRAHPGKRNEDLFVLDFVNDTETIQKAFQPYYESTTVAETADPHQLYDLQAKLDGYQVYTQSEIEGFAKVFYKHQSQHKRTDLGQLYRHLDPAKDRYRALPEEAQDEFKSTLGAFVRLYSFISNVMPFTDPDLEKLYSFARFLLRVLPRETDTDNLQLDEEVTLEYYRLQRTSEGDIRLMAGEEPGVVYGPTATGTGQEKDDTAQLSQILEILNERFGTDFKQNELLVQQVIADGEANEEIQLRAKANSFDNFELAVNSSIDDLVVDRMEKNQDFWSTYFNEEELGAKIRRFIAKEVYRNIRKKSFTPEEIQNLIDKGESASVEYKSSARWDYKKNERNKVLETVIAKTVAGFLNAKGGTLLIGVDDDGNVLGLEPDYKTLSKRPDKDGYEQFLVNLLSSSLGKAAAANVSPSFHAVDGKEICLVDVEPSPSPVYLKDGANSRFYVRTGNATQEFGTKETVEYVGSHWG